MEMEKLGRLVAQFGLALMEQRLDNLLSLVATRPILTRKFWSKKVKRV